MNWIDLTLAVLASAAIAFTWVLVLWGVSIIRRDVSLIDAVFSLIILSIVLVSGGFMGDAPFERKALIIGLMTLWSLRITVHLGIRKWGEGEDPRYTRLRGWVEPGWPFHRFALRQVFALQGVTMFLLSLPLVICIGLAQALAPSSNSP